MTIMPVIRTRTEDREIELLSRYASKSRYTRGRQWPENPCNIRTDFQRDRDRIIHCKAFSRLKHKTQVFIAPAGDHYVTRLTHTLEVTQIARTIARALNLNEDLVEAIGLGHDLGHTPFGHTGEEVLNQLYPGGFRHNRQSLRVVDQLEKQGNGLNLTWEVRDGILNHSKSMEDVMGKNWGNAGTLEADIVKVSDLVAYVNHDIEDAIRAGLIQTTDLPLSSRRVLGENHRQRVNTMVTDIIEASWASSGEVDLQKPAILMSPIMIEAANELKNFLFEFVYNIQCMQQQTEMARLTIKKLYDYLCNHTELLPLDYQLTAEGDPARAVVDYIAGMTDHFATDLARQLSL